MNGQNLRLPTYADFVKAHDSEPDSIELPKGITRLSPGSIGGKSLGVAFIKSALNQGYLLAGEDTNKIVVPNTWLIGTSTDREFWRINGLEKWLGDRGLWPLTEYVKNYSGDGVAAKKVYQETIIPKFMESRLPDELMRGLEMVARSPGPKAVRSSHDLEDTNRPTPGKYCTKFVGNGGDIKSNLEYLAMRIKRVLASSINPDAVFSREKHGMLKAEGNMAITIMDIFGKQIGNLFAPDIAGVFLNKYFVPWCDKIKPEDGVTRLAMGMATRSVAKSRCARDMPLSAPHMRPQSKIDAIIRVSQEQFEALDIRTGQIGTYAIADLPDGKLVELMRILSVVHKHDDNMLKDADFMTLDPQKYRLLVTFDNFARNETRKGGALDIIKTINRNIETLFFDSSVPDRLRGINWEGGFLLNPLQIGLWQCRPMGDSPEFRDVKIPENIPLERTVIYADTALGNTSTKIQHIIFVSEDYKQNADRANEVVRAIGKLDRQIAKTGDTYILIVPGRLGSSDKSLGVPVEDHDVINAKVITEYQTSATEPDLSCCTHFAIDFFGSGGVALTVTMNGKSRFNRELLKNHQSLPTGSEFVKHIYDPKGFEVRVDGRQQKGIIYLED